jgi:hypothetical protein
VDMKRSAFHLMGRGVSVVLMISVLAGCEGFDVGGKGGQLPKPPVESGMIDIPVVNLYVYRVELPIGSTASSEELWGLLDEPKMSREEQRTLANNGIRIATGSVDDWDGVEDVLTNLAGAQLAPLGLVSLRDKAVPVSMQIVEDSRTVFLIHPEGELTGMDYPPSEYFMTFLFTPGADAASQIVTSVPQIQTLERRPMIDTSGGRAELVKRPMVYTINPMTSQFTLGQKAFFVVAPGEGIDRASSLGRALLIRDHDGVPVETIVLIVCEVKTIQRGP